MSGLEGLGNINTDNANGALSTPGGLIRKVDTDPRMFETDPEKFQSNEAFCSYVANWLQGTNLFQVQDALPQTKIALNYTNVIGALFSVDNVLYNIAPCLRIEDTKQLLAGIRTGMYNNQTPLVIISYSNFIKEDLEDMKRFRVEVIDYTGIFDINNAVNSHSAGISFGDSFLIRLQKALASTAPRLNIGETVRMNTESISNDLGSAFKEGFKQLSESLTGALGAIGIGSKKKATDQIAMQNQFGEQAGLEQRGFNPNQQIGVAAGAPTIDNMVMPAPTAANQNFIPQSNNDGYNTAPVAGQTGVIDVPSGDLQPLTGTDGFVPPTVTLENVAESNAGASEPVSGTESTMGKTGISLEKHDNSSAESGVSLEKK